MAEQPIRSTYIIRQQVRKLRNTATSAESILWEHLRNRQINGLKFRRQHPIGRFITDFCCPKSRLVIEIDGAIHNARHEYDQERTRILETKGYRVIRFSNDHIIKNLNSVLQTITALITISPSPTSGRGVPGSAGRGEGPKETL